MKNVLKGLVFASAVLSLTACKNDKPASTETATTTAPVAAPVIDSAAQAATSMATTAAAAAPSSGVAAISKTATEPVKPSTAQTTPAAAPAAATGKTTAIKFDELAYNWGTIAEGDKMTHIFKFKNAGSNDLIISDARGSCGCTVPEWPKEPIKPGKSGEIKVVFDSKGKPGDQQKTVNLTANTDPANTVLTIKGTVKAAAASESK